MSSPTSLLAARAKDSIVAAAKAAGGKRATTFVLGGSAEDARVFTEVFAGCTATSIITETSPFKNAKKKSRGRPRRVEKYDFVVVPPSQLRLHPSADEWFDVIHAGLACTKNTLFITSVQPEPWVPPYPTPGVQDDDFPKLDDPNHAVLQSRFRPPAGDDGHASSSTTLSNDSSGDDDHVGGVRLKARMWTLTHDDFAYVELPSAASWRAPTARASGTSDFRNHGAIAFESIRSEFRVRTVSVEDVVQPPSVAYDALVDGLSNTRRTFVLPDVLRLDDLFEVYQDVWEAE